MKRKRKISEDDILEQRFKRQRGFLRIGGPAIFSGLFAGMSKFTGVPAWKIRIAAVIIAPMTGGIVGWGYILCWLFIPKEDNV